MKFASELTKEELVARWDERTSPQRFAGSDDMFDNIYIAHRGGDRVRLAFKPRSGPDLFGTVFRGRITRNGEGSAITGVFTKTGADYLLAFVLAAVMAVILKAMYDRGLGVMNLYIGMALCAAVLALYLWPKRTSKKKYSAFLKDITLKG